jgi:hypothetical protein
MTRKHLIPLSALTLTLSLIGCDSTPPPPAISFATDIMPVLKQHCLECHSPGGAGERSSGLNLASYNGLMKGTKFGPVVKAGDSLSSTLMILVEGRADESINMPHGGRPPVDAAQASLLRQWIDQGAANN